MTDESAGAVDSRPWGARRFSALLAGGLALIGVLFVVHLCTGTVRLGPDEVLASLLGRQAEDLHRTIVWDLRLPRSLIAIVAGALLGMAGAVLQVVMRNNLAEPGITGVTAGGIFFAVLWTAGIGGLPHPGSFMPLIVLLGCLCAGAIVFALSWRGGVHPLRMVLSGVLVSAILSSMTAFIMLRAQAGVGGILPWIIGALNGRAWVHWEQLWPWAVAALPLTLLAARPLNVLLLGDSVAAARGMRVNLTRAALFCLAALLTAAAVSVVGAVGFLGLVAPHIARWLTGENARRLLPVAAISGAVLLIGADIVSQGITIRPPFPSSIQRPGLPVGAVMAFIGAPFFLYILRRGAAR